MARWLSALYRAHTGTAEPPGPSDPGDLSQSPGVPAFVELRDGMSAQLVDDVTKELFVRRDGFLFSEGHGHPGLVDEISPRDIVVGAVAAP